MIQTGRRHTRYAKFAPVPVPSCPASRNTSRQVSQRWQRQSVLSSSLHLHDISYLSGSKQLAEQAGLNGTNELVIVGAETRACLPQSSAGTWRAVHCIALRRNRNSLRKGCSLLRPACSALAHLLHPDVAERQASLTHNSASRNMASGLPLRTTDSWRPPSRSQPRSGQSCTKVETKSRPLRGQGAMSGHRC